MILDDHRILTPLLIILTFLVGLRLIASCPDDTISPLTKDGELASQAPADQNGEDSLQNILAEISCRGEVNPQAPRHIIYRNGYQNPYRLFDTPPWTLLKKANLESMLATLEPRKDISIPLLAKEAISGQERAKKKDRRRWIEEATCPLVYSGCLMLNGRIRVLIENHEAGTSYFRTIGDSLMEYTILQATRQMVTLTDPTGAPLRLLRCQRNNP